MLERLQKKWNVNGIRLTLIICTFAIGGSLTGYIARKLMPVLGIDKGVLWIISYILLITLLWPLAVLLISIPFGQFRFFRKYLAKVGKRLRLIKTAPSTHLAANRPPLNASSLPIHIAIFASGAGSNAQKIIDYFKPAARVKIALVVCNKPEAGVTAIAARENIPVLIIEKEQFFHSDAYLPELKNHGINFIVLAGFLWKIPAPLLLAYPGRIINIHPALLPRYGGKGMYGSKVHEAVLAAGDTESGITIHYVDEQYDHGATLFQVRCPVYKTDTVEALARRVHELEHAHYPKIIESIVMGLNK